MFLVTASYWLVPWAGLLNASKDTSASGIAVICLGALALNIPAALVHRVLFAMQLVPSSNRVLLLGAVAALLFALAGVQSKVEPLLLIGGIVACPVIVNVLATVSLFARHPRLRPSIVMGREVAVSLLRTGGMFFVIGVLSPIALNADILIVAHIDSVSAVSEYSVVSRTFGAMGLLVTVINLPLWPANAEALARGDLGWVVRTTRRMVALSGIATMALGVALLLVSGPLFQLLGGASIDPSALLVLGFAALWVCMSIAAPLFMVQNSVGWLRPQLVGWMAFLIVSVPLKVGVASQFDTQWIPFCAAVLYLALVFPCAYYGYQSCARPPTCRSLAHGAALTRQKEDDHV